MGRYRVRRDGRLIYRTSRAPIPKPLRTGHYANDFHHSRRVRETVAESHGAAHRRAVYPKKKYGLAVMLTSDRVTVNTLSAAMAHTTPSSIVPSGAE